MLMLEENVVTRRISLVREQGPPQEQCEIEETQKRDEGHPAVTS